CCACSRHLATDHCPSTEYQEALAVVCFLCCLAGCASPYPAFGRSDQPSSVYHGLLVDGNGRNTFDRGSRTGELPENIQRIHQNAMVPLDGFRCDSGCCCLCLVESHLPPSCSGKLAHFFCYWIRVSVPVGHSRDCSADICTVMGTIGTIRDMGGCGYDRLRSHFRCLYSDRHMCFGFWK